jgi:aerobic carbon-monoxide dehydrogenase medium subunit
VRLPPFEIHAPASLAEASELMDRLGDDAVLYAGGTELLLVMKLGFADYRHVVDIKCITELGQIELSRDELVIGGGVTHRAIERSPLVRARWPALAAMAAGVANVRVRGAGTLGGNLAFADPHSDPSTFLLAAGARIEIWGSGGGRTVEIGDFVIGPYQTALAPGEVITAVRVPPFTGATGVAHDKISFHERPAATATCLVRTEAGVVADARIAVGSVGLVPARLPAAERALIAGAHDAELEALARDECSPTEDANGSVEYKRQLAGVLVRRTARQALERAREAGVRT